MEAVKKANNRREACEEPHLSFRDVSLSMVNKVSIPHEYKTSFKRIKVMILNPIDIVCSKISRFSAVL